MDDMTPTDKLRAMLDERGIEWWPDKYYKETNTVWRVGNFEWCTSEQKDGRLLIGCTCIETMTPEQAIAATVGAEPWEPSKEWKAWHESLKHDNPTSIREAVENILYEAIDFGGDMGPNGNVCSGVDEGTVLTENCINGWVKSIEEIAATVGTRTDLSKRLREVHGLHAFAELFGFDWTDESDWDWHDVACAMADAIDATVGVGTCRYVPERTATIVKVPHKDYISIGHYECGLCGASITPVMRYCHGCGAKLEGASE